MALLTSRTLAQSTAITPTTLIHIVTTGDTSQNPQGSSYKAELQQLTPIFGGYTYEIGEYVPSEGGVIFHRYKDGGQERYLVVATTDASTSATWDNRIGPGQPPLLMNQSTWDGFTNFNTLQGSTGAQFTSAAYLVTFYGSSTGLSGWYLPAIDELVLLFNNRFNVNRTLSGNSNSGFISGATQLGQTSYWSSTEANQTIALRLDFGTAGASVSIGGTMKSNSLSVRAIRKVTI
jgi:hypothetical protein